METTLQEIPEDPNEEEEKPSPKLEATPYEKLLQAVHDPKFSHEVALEKRVGLYKFCGDIGRGNFSRVKKAVHLLTKGKKKKNCVNLCSVFVFLAWRNSQFAFLSCNALR